MQWMPFWQSFTSDHVAVKVILHTCMHINFKKPSHGRGGEDGGCTNTHEISPMWQVEAIVHTNMHIVEFEMPSHSRVLGRGGRSRSILEVVMLG
jgi:hypothetical protein